MVRNLFETTHMDLDNQMDTNFFVSKLTPCHHMPIEYICIGTHIENQHMFEVVIMSCSVFLLHDEKNRKIIYI